MSDFSNNELRRIDLTLLLVFLGLLRHRKAVLVAGELGLTQSGVSQALKRLRDVFQDELFLRRPHGLDPTAVALGLEGPVGQAVETLRAALGHIARFDPATAERVIRLAALDAEQADLIPALISVLSDEAPGLRLVVLPHARRAAMEGLAAGEIDIALGFFANVPEALIRTELHTQGFQVAGHPDLVAGGEMTIERFVALPHVLVSPGGELRGVVDDALEAAGCSRHVVAAVPQFFPALAAAATTRCLATLPERIATRYAGPFGLAVVEPPLPLRRFTVSALIHRRNERDAALSWLIARLKGASESAT
jgi:DNA-binding transcriptional LysR family regulator